MVTPGMNCSDVDDLLPGLALGAVTPRERQEVENHMTICQQHPQAEQYARISDILPLSVEALLPPRQVKQRLMTRVYGDLQPVLGLPAWRTAAGWLAAAALAVVALGLGLRDYAMSSQVAAAPVQFELAPTMPGEPYSGSLTWLPSQARGTLMLRNLQPLPAGEVYEVWLIKDGKAVADTVFTPDGDRSAWVALKGHVPAYDLVAVTREPGPSGSAVPTSPPFVAGKLN